MRCREIKEKYNRLTIVEGPYLKQYFNQRASFVKVKCDCGQSGVFEVKLASLRTNHTKSCGCQKSDSSSSRMRKYNLDNPAQPKFNSKTVSGRYMAQLRAGASIRDLEFSITKEDVQRIYDLQQGKCKLSGVDVLFAGSQDNVRRYEQTASVDRIDNSKGYVQGNIQIIHKELNRLKRHYEQHQIIEYCRLISSFQPGQNDDAEMLEDIPTHHKNWKGYGNISLTFWNSIVSGAVSRRIEMLITIEDAWELFVQNNARCAYTGLPISFGYYFGKDSKSQTASLDRIDSNEGYTPENVQWIHKDVNFMKGNLTDQEFRDWCQLIDQHQNHEPVLL